MCFLCLRSHDNDVNHLEAELKKLKMQERLQKAAELKKLLSDPSGLSDDEIQNLRQAQYVLSRDL